MAANTPIHGPNVRRLIAQRIASLAIPAGGDVEVGRSALRQRGQAHPCEVLPILEDPEGVWGSRNPESVVTCAHCEYFDGGGLARVQMARAGAIVVQGDCLCPSSARLQTSSSDSCHLFVRDTGHEGASGPGQTTRAEVLATKTSLSRDDAVRLLKAAGGAK